MTAGNGRRRTGSGPLLAVGAVVFFALFLWQRSGSDFLCITRERELAERVAAASNLKVVEVMAMRDVLGVAVGESELTRTAVQFAELRSQRGDQLAAFAIAGDRELVDLAWYYNDQDPAAAWQALVDRPEVVMATRFLDMRKRYEDWLADQ